MAKDKRLKNRPERKLVIKVPSVVQRLSILDLIKITILNKFAKSEIKKQSPEGNGSTMPDPSTWDEISYIAIVVDGKVADVMRAQPRMASILLSQPLFVEFDPENGTRPMVNDEYKDGKFIHNEQLEVKPQEFKLGEKNEN